MRVARINVDKNIEVLNNLVASNTSLSKEEKTSIQETSEVVQILLDRLSRKKKKSERSSSDKKEKKKGGAKERNQLPSKRYPDVPVIEKELDFEEPPNCANCGGEMKDSGLHECVETLTVIPKKYLIDRLLKKKYRCGGCHMGLRTVPTPPRIVPGSSYSDEMVLDVALSKYCDLIPMERYAMMAERNGLEGLPPNSLIGLTHHLANFLEGTYLKLQSEVKESMVVHADETPHRMLEGGGDKKSWYSWGFSSEVSCFFEIANTRSGDMASNFLKDSLCEYLVSDVFSGYGKAVRDVNEHREKEKRRIAKLLNAYCNAHARRKFKSAEDNFPDEAKVFTSSYGEIYRLNKESKGLSREEVLGKRSEMEFYFKEMKRACEKLEGTCSPHSSLGEAIRYFLKNYSGLTVCLLVPEVPLDNNQEERLLRSSVVGRKTWYGTHSKRGASTSATLFSLVESCKLNGVNPREYFPYVVGQIHRGEEAVTPHEYKQRTEKNLV